MSITKPTEKEFRFTKMTRPDGSPIQETVRESQLSDGQKNFLYDNLVTTFNQAPKEVQHRFLQGLSNKIRKKNTAKMIKDVETKVIKDGKKFKTKESHKGVSKQEKKDTKTS